MTDAGKQGPAPDHDEQTAEVVGMARRIDRCQLGRLNTMRVMMRLYLDEDREKRRKG